MKNILFINTLDDHFNKNKRVNNLTKFFILLLSILFLGQATAQTEIALYSRHKLSNGIVDLPNSDDTNAIVPFGFAVELIRDRTEHKLYAFGAGFRIRNHTIENDGTTNEFFIQAKYKVFNDFAKAEKLSAYFSLAPRLVYLFNNDLILAEPFNSKFLTGGIELPLMFNLEYALSDRLNIHLNLNTVTAAFFYSYQLIENPAIPVNLRSNSGFDLDLNIFNELRIGVGYTL